MPPKKRKPAKNTQDEDPAFSPQAVPATLQQPYTGPDRLTTLPAEIRARICSFLHAPGEARWNDKADLKAVHLTHRELREIAKVELFWFMRLNFIQTTEWYNRRLLALPPWELLGNWSTPKLIQMIEQEPALAAYVHAVRVQVIPVPLPMPDYWQRSYHAVVYPDWRRFHDWMPDLLGRSSTFLMNLQQERAQETLLTPDDPSQLATYRYVDDGNADGGGTRDPKAALASEQPGEHPDDLYYHLFGRPVYYHELRHFRYEAFIDGRLDPDDEPDGQDLDERLDIDEVFFGPNEPRLLPWACFVLDCMRGAVVPHLTNLQHLEAGVWKGPKPEKWSPKDFDYVRQWGLAFANALVLKTSAYSRFSSLGLRGVPPRNDTVATHWSTFLVRQTVARIMHFGHYLVHLDLDVHDLREPLANAASLVPLTMEERTSWPDGLTFWAKMLNRFETLKTLKLTDSSDSYEDRDNEVLCLDELLSQVKLENLKVLHLSGWSVTPETMTERLHASFEGLTVLGLEMLDLHSDDEDAWLTVFGMLKSKYGKIELGPLRDLRRRPLQGSDTGYVKKLLKKQVGVQRQVEDV